MRRFKILFYWLFKNKNRVTLIEILAFLFKPRVKTIGQKFIKTINPSGIFWTVNFNSIPDPLYWPQAYDLSGLFQVTAETLDRKDWHAFEWKETEVEESDIVADLGAAEGLFSLSVVRRCQKVYLLEPDELFFGALQKTFRDFVPEKAELFRGAVGDKESLVSLDGVSLSTRVVEGLKSEVPLVTLDRFFQQRGKVSFLKADLEGYEMKMLKGASGLIKECRPKLAIACYHGSNNHTEMIRFIRNLVPEYHFSLKGVTQYEGKPVLIHFWIPKRVSKR